MGTVLHAGPVVNLVKTNCHLVLDACYTHINALSPVAVVKVGKGLRRQGSNQIGGVVSVGKQWGDQTKTTNGFRTASTDLGRDW